MPRDFEPSHVGERHEGSYRSIANSSRESDKRTRTTRWSTAVSLACAEPARTVLRTGSN